LVIDLAVKKIWA